MNFVMLFSDFPPKQRTETSLKRQIIKSKQMNNVVPAATTVNWKHQFKANGSGGLIIIFSWIADLEDTLYRLYIVSDGRETRLTNSDYSETSKLV